MKKGYLYIGSVWILFIWGCTGAGQSSQNRSSGEPPVYYTSSFPTSNVSGQLEQIERSVLRFTATGFYDTYFFDDQKLTLTEIRDKGVDMAASRSSSFDESKAGTAVSIMQNIRHTVLMTAQHILAFPDTIVTYKKGKDIPANQFVESIAIQSDQRNYLFSQDAILALDAVAEDPGRDIALVKVETPDDGQLGRPLNINLGKARNLRIGSFVYVLGYPLSSPMVTRGIVSAPDFDGRGRFLTDALFNHGISGGLIIATRNNFRSFEWVGMAVTASAIEQQYLVPNPSATQTYENYEAYTDTAFVSRKRVINYGLTQATPIEQIVTFMLAHEDKLNDLGFSVTDLLN